MSNIDFTRDSEQVFHGLRFDVHSLQISDKNNRSVKKEFVVHPGAVTILPFLNEKEIIMIRNERFAVGEVLWELPAGTLETKEPPHETAFRELIEETGYQAKKIELLTTFYTTPGFCNEIMFSYLAKDLNYVGQDLDETEKILVEIIKWSDAINMIKDGTIHDGKTITTLLYYHAFFNPANRM